MEYVVAFLSFVVATMLVVAGFAFLTVALPGRHRRPDLRLFNPPDAGRGGTNDAA